MQCCPYVSNCPKFPWRGLQLRSAPPEKLQGRNVGLDKRERAPAPAPISLSFAWSGGSFASAAVIKTFDFIFFTSLQKIIYLGKTFRRSSKHVICTGARPGVELLQMHPKSQPGCLHLAVWSYVTLKAHLEELCGERSFSRHVAD